MNKLILVGLLVVSGSSFANVYDDYNQGNYQRQMLEQQREQTRIMQQQASNEYNAMADQQMYNDNMTRHFRSGNY